MQARQLRERVWQRCNVAPVGEQDVEGRESTEKGRQYAGRKQVAVNVEFFEEATCPDRRRDLGQAARAASRFVLARIRKPSER